MKDSSIKLLLTFLLISGLYFLLSLLSEFLLLSDDLVYSSLSKNYKYSRIEDIIEIIQNRKWLAWGLIPIILLRNFFLVALCFSIGSLYYGYENSFKTFFRITINAEFVFLIPIILKMIWFSLFKTDYDLIDLKNFSPLSALDIAYHNASELWYIYPLRLLNLFELAYWCILAWQLKPILNRDFAGSLGFVASTYGVGLLLWVIFVMFLTVSLT